MFKDISARIVTADQSEASPGRTDTAHANPEDSGPIATPALPESNAASAEKRKEVPHYQYLPLRNVVISNYGLSAHHEFQTKPSLGQDRSSKSPVPGFAEIISGSTSEMDMTPEGTTQFGDAIDSHYACSSIHYSSQVNAAPFSGIMPQDQSTHYEKLIAQTAGDTGRPQSYTSQAPGIEQLHYITEEDWDFDGMNHQDDLYDSMMNVGPAGSNTLNR